MKDLHVCKTLFLLGLVLSLLTGLASKTSSPTSTSAPPSTSAAGTSTSAGTPVSPAQTTSASSSETTTAPAPSVTSNTTSSPGMTTSENTTNVDTTNGTAETTTTPSPATVAHTTPTTPLNTISSSVSSHTGSSAPTKTNTSPASSPTATGASQSTPNTSASTPGIPTSTPSSSSSIPTHPPLASDVVISETNLLLGTPTDFFVELRGSVNETLDGLTVIVLDGTAASVEWRKDFNSSDVFNSSDFLTEPITVVDSNALTVVVVALYNTSSFNNLSLGEGLVDFTLYSTDPSAKLLDSLQETLLPNGQPLTVIDRKAISPDLTISRCADKKPKTPSHFVLSKGSRGESNPCEGITPGGTQRNLQLHPTYNGTRDCQVGEEGKWIPKVVGRLVEAINERCKCGLTTWLVQGSLYCPGGGDMYLMFNLSESYTNQTQRVLDAFFSLTNETISMTVNGKQYQVVNCTQDCVRWSPHIPPGSSKSSTNVTVAVVCSCVLVFIIVLISVILYMRGKRRGIIRQFRMTRLQEDDDMDDMDDFIGGGGEASFSARSSR